MTNLRKTLELESRDALLDFHSKNQMLFMCYDQGKAKNLIELIKNRETHTDNFHDKLKKSVYDILNRLPNSDSMFGSIMYIFNIINDRLHISEKEYFDSLMSDYSKGLISYSEISTLLYSWALRFELEKIQSQTIFNPYPKELSYDSKGKPRKVSVLKI